MACSPTGSWGIKGRPQGRLSRLRTGKPERLAPSDANYAGSTHRRPRHNEGSGAQTDYVSCPRPRLTGRTGLGAKADSQALALSLSSIRSRHRLGKPACVCHQASAARRHSAQAWALRGNPRRQKTRSVALNYSSLSGSRATVQVTRAKFLHQQSRPSCVRQTDRRVQSGQGPGEAGGRLCSCAGAGRGPAQPAGVRSRADARPRWPRGTRKYEAGPAQPRPHDAAAGRRRLGGLPIRVRNFHPR